MIFKNFNKLVNSIKDKLKDDVDANIVAYDVPANTNPDFNGDLDKTDDYTMVGYVAIKSGGSSVAEKEWMISLADVKKSGLGEYEKFFKEQNGRVNLIKSLKEEIGYDCKDK